MYHKYRLSLLLIALGLLGGLFLVHHNVSAAPGSRASAYVSANDLTAAGFTDIRVQPPEGDSFPSSMYYFRVKEAVTGAQSAAWGQAANLVAVLVRLMPDTAWKHGAGTMEITDLAGRTKASIGANGYYIVVIGPDRDKVVKLATNLQTTYMKQ